MSDERGTREGDRIRNRDGKATAYAVLVSGLWLEVLAGVVNGLDGGRWTALILGLLGVGCLYYSVALLSDLR
jgi:hypothetical protein